jgi:hypothetical protein
VRAKPESAYDYAYDYDYDYDYDYAELFSALAEKPTVQTP